MTSLSQSFAEQLKQVLQMMTLQNYEAKISEAVPARLQEALWWEQRLSVAPDSPLLVGATRSTWIDVGTRALLSAGVESVDEEDAKSTYLEILQQAISGLARSVSGDLKRPVEAGVGKELTSAPLLASAATVHLTGDAGEEVILFAHFPTILPGEAELPTAVSARSNAFVGSGTSASAAADSAKLEALLDVELPASLCFGRTRLELREVLKLSEGAVVELHKTPDDPVEIIVSNCVIARGQVVTIDGNYGVRVQRVISKQERLALHRQIQEGAQ